MKSSLPLGTIVQGEAREVMRTWPDASVQCCVTSPAYWGLRNYQAEGKTLVGQYGQEPTIEEHIAVLVEFFREVRRVLRPDGTLWLNYGDAYSSGGRAAYDATSANKGNGASQGLDRPLDGLGPKNLLMLPARLAIALQADGWTLRSDIIWSKPNPMPESVTDRPATAHEHVFLLTPGPRYYYDAEAVREVGGGRLDRWPGSNGRMQAQGWKAEPLEESAGRNLRNVWTIAPQPYAGAHYATFPEALVEPCIKAGTSERGACPACGAPWKRVVEKERESVRDTASRKRDAGEAHSRNGEWEPNQSTITKTIGWEPGCACPGLDGDGPWSDLSAHPDGEANWPRVPCIVMDPFAGSGTVGVVAYKLGREFVGIDLAGGDADMGGHTAHDRINAAREGGRSVAEHVGHREAGQIDLLGDGNV